jgi:hypothetical protein
MFDAGNLHRVESIDVGGSSIELQRIAIANDQLAAAPFRFGLRSLFIGVTTFAVLFVIVQTIWRRSQQASVEGHIRNNIKQIELGLLNLESARQEWADSIRTDANGLPLYSWRFHVWPYMESTNLRRDFKASWNAPTNRQSRQLRLLCFCWDEGANATVTDVFAIAGPGTAFDKSQRNTHDDFPSDLIQLMEAADSKTHWMEPGDYNLNDLLAATGRLGNTVKGLLSDRVHVLFADGEVWALSPDMPIDAAKPFFTISGAKAASREESLSKYRVD